MLIFILKYKPVSLNPRFWNHFFIFIAQVFKLQFLPSFAILY